MDFPFAIYCTPFSLPALYPIIIMLSQLAQHSNAIYSPQVSVLPVGNHSL